MEVEKIKELRAQIVSCLVVRPECRNSDITLTIEVWKTFYEEYLGYDNNGNRTVDLGYLYKLPREDNVKRIRAKLQEEAAERINTGKTLGNEECFFPTSAEVAKRRKLNIDVWEKALGYHRKQENLL